MTHWHAIQKILQECQRKHLTSASYIFHSFGVIYRVLLSSLGSFSGHGHRATRENTNFSLKVCLKNWSSDYDDLSTANIPTLSARLYEARLCHMYKHKQTDFPDVPINGRTFHYRSKVNNSMAIKPYQCWSTQLLNSFFPDGALCQRVWFPKILLLHLNTLFIALIIRITCLLIAYGYIFMLSSVSICTELLL